MQKKRLRLSLLIAAAACGTAAVAAAAPASVSAAGAPLIATTAGFAGDIRSQAAEQVRAPRPRAQQQTRSDRRAADNGRARSESARRNRGAVRSTAPAPAKPAPRLQLDAAEPQLSEEALAIERAIEVVAYAASAARQAASAASAAQGRIQSLERTVGELRDETSSQREQLARQDHSRRWLWLLGAAVLLLGGLALWLARRLVTVQRDYEQRWLAAGPAPAALPPVLPPTGGRPAPAAVPFVSAEPRRLPAHHKPTVSPAWPPAAPAQPWDDPALQATKPLAVPAPPSPYTADTAMQRTEALPPGVRGGSEETPSSPRDVSIEELIDLEQQAEFFIVLGQDDAAIDLLSEHLRNSGGGSPLPYLKLLEIYRRRGDRSDYERIRTRFNHRFNAYAPEWGSDLGAGRSLEDYAGILPRLQQAWQRPLDAMAEMEALLFRKSRGDLFDLPAYRELLFLYSLARDLLDREAADTGTVDLLLPLSKSDARGGEFGPTAPAPFLGLDAETGTVRGDGEERTTLPLDFDLTLEGQRQTSIFDPLDRHGKPVK